MELAHFKTFDINMLITDMYVVFWLSDVKTT